MLKNVHDTFFCLTVMVVLGAAAIGCSCGGQDDRLGAVAQPVTPRSDRWAESITDRPGVPNLHRVNEGLYRSAQPEDEGFAELKAMGIKTVVNLRTFGSDRKECKRSELDYVKISMQAWNASDSDVEEFLRVATDPDRQPVLVHCLHGADRTGMAFAVYRIVVEGWSKQDALDEMTGGGYGFHVEFDNLIRYVEKLDVEKMRKRAGLSAP